MRLRSVVSGIPKVMAPVNGKPFIDYLFAILSRQHIYNVVLSAGYKHEILKEHAAASDLNINVAVEQTPLGTGGGIVHALKLCESDDVLVLNGDSMFNIGFNDLLEKHSQRQSRFSIALKSLKNFDRYGTVMIDDDFRVSGFGEKQKVAEGLINAGVYIISRKWFLDMDWPEAFSLEKDFLEKQAGSGNIFGFPFDGYFIDIGIPEDYEKAGRDFKALFNEQ
jgi:D-glycero-alpha-D-manno-heptose 1-phosphate guanylyltransferase